MHLGVAVLGFLGLASQGGGRSFSSKPAWASTLFSVLDCSGWCWDDRPETTATQSTANKALHSSPVGQWLFCLTFACSCKWFIKNCSIFLVSCTLNGQIFFSCNSVLDSLYPFVLFPVVYSDKARMLCAGGEKSNEIKHYGRCCSDNCTRTKFQRV